MSIYELGYLILPSIAEEGLKEVVATLKALVAKEGGVEIDGEAPIKHDLAYTMSKTVGASRYVVNDAFIGWIKFEMEPEKAPVLKTEVEKMDAVLRCLLIKAPRDTYFTFAKAMEAQEAEEAGTEVEGEAVEATPGTVEEAVVE